MIGHLQHLKQALKLHRCFGPNHTERVKTQLINELVRIVKTGKRPKQTDLIQSELENVGTTAV